MTTSVPTIPDVPARLKNSDNALAQAMVPVFEATVLQARQAAEVIGKYRASHVHETELLNTSEEPEVAAYRRARDARDARIKQYKEDYEAQIKEFVELLNQRTKDAESALAEKESAARKALNVENGVTAEDNVSALERYKAAADTIKLMVAGVKKQGVDVGNYALPSMAPGGSNGAKRGFVPRFESITVNGNKLPSAKTNDLAALVGAKRDFVIKVLENAVGGDRSGWDELDALSEVQFAITNNDVRYDITVVKAEPAVKAKKNPDGTLVEVTDDDDDDDEDDDDN